MSWADATLRVGHGREVGAREIMSLSMSPEGFRPSAPVAATAEVEKARMREVMEELGCGELDVATVNARFREMIDLVEKVSVNLRLQYLVPTLVHGIYISRHC